MKRFLLLILFSGIFQLGIASNEVDTEPVVHPTQEVKSDKNNLLSDTEEYTSNRFVAITRGSLGLAFLIFVAFLFSNNRKSIDWKMVGIGLVIQLVLAFGVLKIDLVRRFFEIVGKLFVKVLDFTQIGSTFLFRDLMNVDSFGYIFALQILPTIIFFSALTSVLFYLGIIQKIVFGLAWVMTKALRLSGAESLSVAGNIFLGQTESSPDDQGLPAYLPR